MAGLRRPSPHQKVCTRCTPTATAEHEMHGAPYLPEAPKGRLSTPEAENVPPGPSRETDLLVVLSHQEMRLHCSVPSRPFEREEGTGHTAPEGLPRLLGSAGIIYRSQRVEVVLTVKGRLVVESRGRCQ